MGDTLKAWLPPSASGEVGAVVDKIELGYGKANAVEITEAQLDRLHASDEQLIDLIETDTDVETKTEAEKKAEEEAAAAEAEAEKTGSKS